MKRGKVLVEDRIQSFVSGAPPSSLLSFWEARFIGEFPRLYSCLPPVYWKAWVILQASKRFDHIVLDFQSIHAKLAVILCGLARTRAKFCLLVFRRCRGTRFSERMMFHPMRLLLWVAFRRSLESAHVLCPWERDYYSRFFGVARDKFYVSVWPVAPKAVFPASGNRTGLIFAGYSFNDYKTYVSALRGSSYASIVLGRNAEVRAGLKDAQSNMVSVGSVTKDAYFEYLQSCRINVIAVCEMLCSTGLNRLRDSAECGIPVIVARVKGIEEYLQDGVSCLFYEPGNSADLRAKVDRLYDDDLLQVKLINGLRATLAPWTKEAYEAGIKRDLLSLGVGTPEELPEIAPQSSPEHVELDIA